MTASDRTLRHADPAEWAAVLATLQSRQLGDMSRRHPTGPARPLVQRGAATAATGSNRSRNLALARHLTTRDNPAAQTADRVRQQPQAIDEQWKASTGV